MNCLILYYFHFAILKNLQIRHPHFQFAPGSKIYVADLDVESYFVLPGMLTLCFLGNLEYAKLFVMSLSLGVQKFCSPFDLTRQLIFSSKEDRTPQGWLVPYNPTSSLVFPTSKEGKEVKSALHLEYLRPG